MPLPLGVSILDPLHDNVGVLNTVSQFYKKYYDDHNPRHLVLGINPGRLGAGSTGIPFTDTKRLKNICEIDFEGFQTHEPSSVFVYDVIDAAGGPDLFFKEVYINSVCPVGFVKTDVKTGKQTNFNYYDDAKFAKNLENYIVAHIKEQQAIAQSYKKVFILGTGKNFQYVLRLNQKYKLFTDVIPLEHPRYIMQYKLKTKVYYVNQYLSSLKLPRKKGGISPELLS